MVRVISNEREVVATLASPLIQSSLDILGSANLEQDGLLVRICGYEGIEDI